MPFASDAGERRKQCSPVTRKLMRSSANVVCSQSKKGRLVVARFRIGLQVASAAGSLDCCDFVSRKWVKFV
eukprot:2216698-Rhodomonas_salina.2